MSKPTRLPGLIRVFAPGRSHRITFAVDVVFTRILGWEIDWVDAAATAHVAYCQDAVVGPLFIQPSEVVQPAVMVLDPPRGADFMGQPTLFPTAGELGFDVFGAVLFLVTRMEEYGDSQRDSHGRFPAAASWMGRNNCIDQPLVDQWAYALRDILTERFSDLEATNRSFAVESTIDIDSAYAFKGKERIRTLGAYAKDLLKGKFQQAKLRFRAIQELAHDPFDTYDRILAEHTAAGIAPLFFFLLADRSEYDVNLVFTRPAMQALITELSERAEVGIHPGYYAADNEALLAEEIGRLGNCLRGNVEQSRYHFLRGSFPASFDALAHYGISKDYTLGFADQLGFRTGSCTPLPYFDLASEVLTGLTLHPTHIMDTTLVRYLKRTPAEALSQAEALIEKVKAVDGTVCLLWHNETWSEAWHWKGWGDFPARVLALCRPEEA